MLNTGYTDIPYPVLEWITADYTLHSKGKEKNHYANSSVEILVKQRL